MRRTIEFTISTAENTRAESIGDRSKPRRICSVRCANCSRVTYVHARRATACDRRSFARFKPRLICSQRCRIRSHRTSCAARSCSASSGRAAAPTRARGTCIARAARPPSPRHAGCMARDKECDRACRQPARRGFPPGLWREHRESAASTRPTLSAGRAAHVGPPKTRMRRTPARAFVARAFARAPSSRACTLVAAMVA